MFQEQRLELGLNFGATYGPRFSTAIATQSDGQEQRRAMWSQPLIVANLAGRAVDKIELDYLLDFHASVKGSAYGFRLKDWSDYQSGLTAIGTGNGTAQTWQLIKRYTVGGYTVTRSITKPTANSLTLYLNGIATATGWSIDTTTGVLTTTLTGAIAVDFEFDVPVRFAEDQIKFTFEAADPFDATRRIFTLDALTCTEIRIEPTIYPAIDPFPDSMPLFNLGYDYGTNGGPQFDTGIASTASEFEARIPYLDTPKGSWNIGDRTLDRAQVDYFLAFYRLCRGMAVPFLFKDWQDETTKPVRFAEDRISLQFNAYRPHDQQVIFYLGGLAIVEAPPPPVCTPQSLTFTDPLSSPWPVVSQQTTGIYSGATYDVDISSGYWRTTLVYGDGIPGGGYAAYIEWGLGWSYTPQFENEIINISFTSETRFISHTNHIAGVSSYPFVLIAKQGGNVVTIDNNIGLPSPNTSWTTETKSALFSTFAVGIPIVFTITINNSTFPSSNSPVTTITEQRNVTVTVDVTCG